MSGFGKWLGGGLGFVLGGPVGALLGFTLGSLMDGAHFVSSSNESRGATEGDFKISLLVLMACVMKADGKVLKSELDVVKQFLLQNFGEEGALEALGILKNLLNTDINETEVAMQIGRNLNYSAKLELLHLLLEIANADGEVHGTELNVIERISIHFNIDKNDFLSIKAPYFKHQDRYWAYKALEIEPNATTDEIKKAYRRMAMKYHPDKVANLGDEVKKTATDKFRTINEAYEDLKKQRGIV